jgi:TetR/AcrR family transcriptional regulator
VSAIRSAKAEKIPESTIDEPIGHLDADVARKPARGRSTGFSKEKILAVATKMFAEQGFSAVSVRDIAGACGITLPTIYHFFGDKENLYRACCDAIFFTAAQRLNVAVSAAGTPEARIRQFAVTLCDILMNNTDFRRLLQRELLRREQPAVHDLTSHHFRAEFELFAHEFRQLDPTPNAIDHTFSVYALTFGLVQLRRVSDKAGIEQQYMSTPVHLAEFVLSTILPQVNWGK